jgi:hypothetical protein
MHYKKLSIPTICLAMASPLAVFAAENPEKSPWALEVETGIGYDSNVFLSPSKSYIDFAAVGGPTLVNPEKRSGVFIPLGVAVDYDGRQDETYGFIGSYSFDSQFYPDSKTENANEYNHTLTGGVEFLLNKVGKRQDTVSVTPYFGVHQKTYFNRDSGETMVSTTSGVDLSDRYSYNVTGLKTELKHNTARLPHSLHAEVATLDYVEPSPAFDSYDHTFVRIGGDVEFVLAQPTRLTVGYDYYTRDYDDRKARDLSGSLKKGTTREYVYNKLGASLRQKINPNLSLYLDYDFIDRNDEYVGYYDYTQNGYGVRAIYDNGERIRIKAKAAWWQRDYDNAFAFDDPSQEYDSAEYLVKGDYALDNEQGIWAELKMVDKQSTDLRYDYDRYQTMVGWRWEK